MASAFCYNNPRTFRMRQGNAFGNPAPRRGTRSLFRRDLVVYVLRISDEIRNPMTF